jgi:CHASE2 domain-containing sensor protein
MNLFSKLWLSYKHFATLLPKKDLVFWVAFAVAPFFILIAFPSFIQPVNQAVLDIKVNFDMRFLNRKKVENTVILGIDSKTLTGAPVKWPWPGKYWAEILHGIDKKYMPKAFLLDIYFQQNTEENHEVSGFSAELARNQKTGLVGIFEESLSEIGTELKVFPPIKSLRKNAAFWGISQQPIDSDGKVRTFVLSDYRINNRHIAFEYLNKFSRIETKYAWLNQFKKAAAIFRFKARENSARILSLAEAINGRIPVEQLRGKLLLIGPNAPILHDYHQTPVGVLTGPELVSNSIQTLENGEFQIRLESFSDNLLYVFLGILFGLFCFVDIFKKPARTVVVTGIVFFVGLFVFSFVPQIHPPVGAAYVSFLLFSIMNLLLLRFIEISKIRDSLHEAEICGNIQQKFFPASGLESQGIQIDGNCLPYQNAGGDYYDFHELKNGDIFFILGDVSGHGISAAMITTAAKSIVSLHIERDDFSVENVFSDINLAIRKMSDRRIMMSAVAGIIDRQNSKLSIFSAGHLPAHLKIGNSVKEFPLPGNPYGHVFIATGKMAGPNDPIIITTTSNGIKEMPMSRMGGGAYLGWAMP